MRKMTFIFVLLFSAIAFGQVKAVSATMAQVSGKWTIVDMHGEAEASIAHLLATSPAFLELSPDGKYKAVMMTMEEAGTWAMGDNGTTIEMTKKGFKWTITRISDTELVLHRDSGTNMYLSKPVR